MQRVSESDREIERARLRTQKSKRKITIEKDKEM